MGTPYQLSGELQLTRQEDGPVTVLALAGELDLATTPQLDQALEEVNGRGTIVLDLDDLTFIDSHGLHAIFRRALTHDLIVARPPPNIARVLALTKGDRILRIEDTLEAALGNA
jgi:anti-sigma B factor antagonist